MIYKVATPPERVEGCRPAYLVLTELGAVITFWYDENRVVKAFHSTDWDNAGWDVIKKKALEWDFRWKLQER